MKDLQRRRDRLRLVIFFAIALGSSVATISGTLVALTDVPAGPAASGNA